MAEDRKNFPILNTRANDLPQLYEIHISVDLSETMDEISWLLFCKENKYHSIRILNDSGKYPVQNMISKWCPSKSPDDAVSTALEISEKMKSTGFKVLRIKVEGMMENKQFDSIVLDRNPSHYWEFHFKVIVDTDKEITRLCKVLRLLVHDARVSLSLSSRSATLYPILTIRKHDGTREEAIFLKDKIVDLIKSSFFRIHGKLQSECSVYDTFPGMDEGWIC